MHMIQVVDGKSTKNHEANIHKIKKNFDNQTKNTFQTSYLKNNNSEPILNKMSNNIQTMIDKIDNAFTNISNWVSRFNSEYEGTENYLSGNGTRNGITDPNIQGALAQLPALNTTLDTTFDSLGEKINSVFNNSQSSQKNVLFTTNNLDNVSSKPANQQQNTDIFVATHSTKTVAQTQVELLTETIQEKIWRFANSPRDVLFLEKNNQTYEEKQTGKLITELKSIGLQDADIEAIVNKQKTIQQVFAEINDDTDNTRRQSLLTASYLNAYDRDYSNIESLYADIESQKRSLSQFRQRLSDQEQFSHSKEHLLNILTRLRLGEDFKILTEGTPVAWEYRDETGTIHYRFDDPGVTGSYTEGTRYTPKSFIDMYGNDALSELQSMTKEDYTPLFSNTQNTRYYWSNSQEQLAYYDKIFSEYKQEEVNNKKRVENLNNIIATYEENIASNEAIYKIITDEVNHYMNNIDPYINNADFQSNSNYNTASYQTVENLDQAISNATKVTTYTDARALKDFQIPINDKEQIVNIINCLLNGKTSPKSEIVSQDSTLQHFQKWYTFATDTEVSVFNYIYNTQGIDGAYDYLQSLSDELDARYLTNKTKTDQDFAKEHPVLSSVGSIAITPIEGMSAAAASLNALINAEKLRRTDVYSSGDIWRSSVASEIAINYGEGWSFAYSTGMSMADSVSLIALSALTGGASPVISATTMGSRAYVSTLNAALDRGIDDKEAIILASTSAIVETAMENYSVSHLLNLETSLGKNTIQLADKIASNITNPTIANLATKSFYIGANAVNQALIEGEEELATEILNYAADYFIAKDLSNYSLSVEDYLSKGYEENEAGLLTMKDFSKQAFQAYLGGFVSGICFGAFGGTINTINISQRIAQNMYDNLEGHAPASKFAKALEINQAQLEKIGEIVNKLKNNQSLTVEEFNFLMQGTLITQDVQVKRDVNHLDSEKTSVEETNIIKNSSEQTSIEKDASIDLGESIVTKEPSAEPQTSNIITDKINELVTDNERFVEYANNLVLNNISLPDEYTSIDDYKKDFVHTLIDTDTINTISSYAIYTMSRDAVMLKELVGTEKLNQLYIKNITKPKVQADLVPRMCHLDVDEIDTIFNSPSMREFINSLNIQDLHNLLVSFGKNDNVAFLLNDTVTDRLISLNVNDFYACIDNLNGLPADTLGGLMNNDNIRHNYTKLLSAIETKYLAQDVIVTDVSRLTKLDALLPLLFDVDSTVKAKIDDVKLKIKSTLDGIKQIFKDTCGYATSQINEYSFGVEVDESKQYYDVIFEIDGQTKKETLTQQDGILNLNYIIFNVPAYVKLIAEGKVKILSVNENTLKNALVLNSEQGLNVGLNEVTMIVDGVQHTFITYATSDSKDLNWDANPLFKNARSIEVVSVKNKGNLNVEVEDTEALYKVIYEINGVQKETFMVTPKVSYLHNTDNHILNINDYVGENNLIGIENIQVEKVSTPSYLNAIVQNSSKTFEKLMKPYNYGGNQSDVKTLIDSLFCDETMTALENKKATLLNDCITKYFPDATATEKMLIATNYASGGCAYMAIANAFMTYIASQENGMQIFKEKMGFDMTFQDGEDTSFNLEALALDMFLADTSQHFDGNLETLYSRNTGLNWSSLQNSIVSYFRNKGFDMRASQNVYDLSSQEKIYNTFIGDMLNQGNGFNIVSASNFDLNLLEGASTTEFYDAALSNTQIDGDTYKKIGGHSVLITGISESLNPIVSSWKKKFEFLLPSLLEYKNDGASMETWHIEFGLPPDIANTTLQ